MRFLDHFTVGSRAIPGGSIERTCTPVRPLNGSRRVISCLPHAFAVGAARQISVRFSICSFSVLPSDPIGFSFVFSAVQHAFPWYAPPCVL